MQTSAMASLNEVATTNMQIVGIREFLIIISKPAFDKFRFETQPNVYTTQNKKIKSSLIQDGATLLVITNLTVEPPISHS